MRPTRDRHRGGAGLIDFNASDIGQARAEEQLAGAVAMHNILERHNVAYLADEVGMGKTYVALGAMALFRHFDAGVSRARDRARARTSSASG